MKQQYIHIGMRLILMLFAGLFITSNLFAQSSVSVTGRVLANGKPLSGISVSIENEFIKTQTRADGEFVILVNEGQTLLFSGKGYKQHKHIVENSDEPLLINMELFDDEILYTVGYSERNKTLLTAAVSTTKGETLAKSPVPVVNDAIQGHLTGLTVERTSGNEPGWSLSNFYVRGLGTFGAGRAPLVIVDDIERDITQLDPEEIESITVLKDAAATVNYGMRAANGVINVKTKRGYIGKPEISLKVNFGLQTPTVLPKYLGSQEYVRFRNIALSNDGLPIPNDPTYDPAMYDGTHNPHIYGNTDWYDEFVKKVTPLQMYRVSVTGGNEMVKYYVTLGVTNQAGIYNYTKENKGFDTNPDYNRYNVRANTDINLNKNLSVSLDLGGKLETKRIPRVSASTIFSTLSILPPTMPIKNEDGSIAGTSVYRDNPYGYLAKSGYEDQYNRYLQGNVSANYKLDALLKGLSVNAMFAFDSYKLYARGKSQNYAVYQRNQDGTYSKFGEDSDLSLQYYSSDNGYTLQTTFTAGASYNNKINAIHDLVADVKFMQSHYTQPGNFSPLKEQSVFGRFTYAYDSRYVADLGLTYGGSENFRKGKRFGWFPVGSVAWVASNESFLQDVEQINFLKLRASYGIVGNADIGIGRFPYMGQYYLGSGYVFGDSYAGSDGAYEGRLKNPDLTYEESRNANIGLDMDLFKNRLSLSVDFFRNDRKNIIGTRDNVIPGVVGQLLPYENIGSVLNKGFEVMLRHQNQVGKFGYFAQANISFARNEITSMEETAGMEPWTYLTGRQIDVVRGFEAVGFFNNQEEIDGWAKSTYGTVKPGDIKYKDQNGDHIIDDNDMVPLGYSNIPEWNFGLNLGFNYKNFDLSMLFTAVANRTLIVANNVFLGMQGNSKITDTAYDTWQKGVNEVTAKYPRLTTEIINHNMRNSTVWSHKGDYFRLQNIEIGYNLPSSFLSKLGIMSTRFFLSGHNLFSFDGLKKYNVSADYPNAGISAYPEIRVYNVGVNIKF